MPPDDDDAAKALLFAAYDQHRHSLPAEHQDHTPESLWQTRGEATRDLYRKLAAGQIIELHVGADVTHGTVTMIGGKSYPYTAETIGKTRRITLDVPTEMLSEEVELALRIIADQHRQHEWRWEWIGNTPHLTNGRMTLTHFATSAYVTIRNEGNYHAASSYIPRSVLEEFLWPKKQGEPPGGTS